MQDNGQDFLSVNSFFCETQAAGCAKKKLKIKKCNAFLFVSRPTENKKGLIAFDRTHYIYVIFQSRKFYVFPRVLVHHLELTDRLALDLMLVSIRCHGEFQKHEIMTLSLEGG